MAMSLNMTSGVEGEWQDSPDDSAIAKLQAAVDARSAALRTITPDSIVAATIFILSSLKAATPKAPRQAPEGSYKIVPTDMFGGLYRERGQRTTHICARIGNHYGPKANIRPAIGFPPGNNAALRSRVYAIYTSNPHDTFERNVNRPNKCWYVLCEHEGQAIAYAKAHVKRILSKESGMAKYALGIAQAKASTRTRVKSMDEAIGNGGMAERAVRIAYDAAELDITQEGGATSGICEVTFVDQLNYSAPAAGGDAAVRSAIDKASNRLIGAFGSEEMKAALLPHNSNAENDVLNAFRAHWIVRNAGSDRITGRSRAPF